MSFGERTSFGRAPSGREEIVSLAGLSCNVRLARSLIAKTGPKIKMTLSVPCQVLTYSNMYLGTEVCANLHCTLLVYVMLRYPCHGHHGHGFT